MRTRRVTWICLAAALLCGAGCAEGVPLPVAVLADPGGTAERITGTRKTVAYDVSDFLADGRTTPEEFLSRVRGGNCGEITYELRGSTLTAIGNTRCHRDLVEWLANQRALTHIRRGS